MDIGIATNAAAVGWPGHATDDVVADPGLVNRALDDRSRAVQRAVGADG